MSNPNFRNNPAPNWGPPEILPNELEILNLLGNGSFGKVYRGRCRSKDVAVKVLHHQELDEATIATFRKEVEIVSKIFHPNIVLFMGACIVPESMMIVTELMPKGNLETLLQDTKIQLGLLTRMKMIKDAALGMTWLHGSNPQFIHRDFKTSNLLVSENNRIKICDFGLSQIKKQGENLLDGTEGAKGTPLWMAPEVLCGREFNEKADVYSFGIVLWEVLTREEPFQEFESFEEFKFAVCVKHYRPAIPQRTHPSLKSLIECCWQPDPNHRPSFPEIVHALEYIIIDCAIQDEIGRRIWKEHFLKQECVPWEQFLESFFDLMDYFGDVTYRPLPEQPTQQQICAAYEFQLNEYARRSPAHDQIVRKERERRQIRGEIPGCEDLKLLCMKTLLVESHTGEVVGDGTEMVSMEKFGNTLDWFGPVVNPRTRKVVLLDTLFEILTQPWFHGEISQVEAENRLARRPVGVFLLRFSSIVGCFTVSKVCNGAIAHQRIIHHTGSGYSINQFHSESLVSLVQIAAKELALEQSCPGSRYMAELFNEKTTYSGYIQPS